MGLVIFIQYTYDHLMTNVVTFNTVVGQHTTLPILNLFLIVEQQFHR